MRLRERHGHLRQRGDLGPQRSYLLGRRTPCSTVVIVVNDRHTASPGVLMFPFGGSRSTTGTAGDQTRTTGRGGRTAVPAAPDPSGQASCRGAYASPPGAPGPAAVTSSSR